MPKFTSLAARLNEEPEQLSSYELTGDDFAGVLFQLLYAPEAIAFVPKIIQLAYDGDFSLFERLGEATSGGGVSFGMHLSLQCSEEVPFTPAEEYDELDSIVPEALRSGLTGKEYLQWCERWPVERAPASENEPVVSDIPTLVISGWFDPITPPEFAEAANEFLSNSSYFMIDNESHGASLGDCGLDLSAAFIDDPTAVIDGACVNGLTDIDFESRGLLGPSFGRSGIEFITGRATAAQLDAAKQALRLRSRLSGAPRSGPWQSTGE
jgi:pimeloyl-ACP methyl ester carboxylesterase